MLTKKQTFLYWKTWAAICAAQGWERNDNARRYALHEHSRCPQSMKDFTNRDFSQFLSASAPLRDQIDIRDRDRENALHTIRKDAARAGFDEAYLRRIAADLYDTSAFEDLPHLQLENFRNVIHNRSSRRSRPSAEAEAHQSHQSSPAYSPTEIPSVNPF
jgi:hypothetical protein